MNKSLSTLTTKPKWDWTQVDCNLKLEISRKYTTWSLAPHIVLTNPTGQGPDPTVKLFVDTEKSLQFNQESQWNWHKSWNLPNIAVRVEVKDSSTGEGLLAPKKLFVQLFAVKTVPELHDKQQNTHLIDVGIRGNSKIEMEDGQAFFTAMKFSSTSYNHQGVKFYLLLVLYIQPGNPTDAPKIITSIVSPPIFVDSRKSARDNHQKKNESFIEPFLVQNLQKQYIKRQNKKRSQSQIKIKNDFEGLFNYLTAPNIRHKVKHPLFIAIKFSQCAKLFYNSNQTGKEVTLNEVVNALQRKISKDHFSRHAAKSSMKTEDKMFVLQISSANDEIKKKKIFQSIDPVECSSLGIVYSDDELPPYFENFSNLGNMAVVYKDEYSQLYITTRSIFDAEVSEGDSEPESDEEERKQEPNSGDSKSQSEKESSYPQYNIKNNQRIVENTPVQKIQKPDPPSVNVTVQNAPTEQSFKRSLSDPISKKPDAQRPSVQVSIPDASMARKDVPNLGGQLPPSMMNFGMNPSQPNYIGQMNMEQLYFNNFMLSNAINNLKPVYSNGMPNNLPNNMTGSMANSMNSTIPNNNMNNMNMYNLMRGNGMQGMRVPPFNMNNMNVGMNDMSMMMPGFNQSVQNPSQSTPTKVGFSPAVQQSDPSMSQMGQMNEQQYMMMKQQVYKELYMQMFQQQNQQRGMMPGQQIMPNMNNSMPGMNTSMSRMNPQMGSQMNPQMPNMNMGMGMGQMGQMGMNPYMYMPENMGFQQEPKAENK